MDIAETARRVTENLDTQACIVFDDKIKIKFLFLVLYS